MTLNTWNGLPDPKMPAQAGTEQERARVLFNPYTGERRHINDVQSDPQGLLIVAPGAELQAARRAPVVPQGWLFVPKVADEKMQRAIAAQFNGTAREAIDAWSEALAAAPQPPEAQSKWEAFPKDQAARRTPAAPVPQGLREAAQAVVERWDTPLWKDVPATAVYIAELRAALAAAPQPPEAEIQPKVCKTEIQTKGCIEPACNPSMQPLQADHIPDAGEMVAAPVQLPEPVGVLHVFTAKAENGEATMAVLRINDANAEKQPLGYHNVVTEQQVRPLLETQKFQLDELAMLTRKLVRSLRKAAPGNESAEKALDYLKRKGLGGKPLRAAQEQST